MLELPKTRAQDFCVPAARRRSISWLGRVARSVTFIGLLSLSAGPSAASQLAEDSLKPIQRPTLESIHGDLQLLDQEIDQIEERLERNGFDSADPQVELIEARLELLESELHRLPQANAEPLRTKLGLLRHRVSNLRAAVERGALPDFGRRQGRHLPRGPEVPPNDDCADATVIGIGTFFGDTSEATNDGQTTCGSSLFSRDVWFRVTVPTNETFFVDTFGSGFDTVLSVHTECPGTVANTLTCNDDTLGLDSAVEVAGPAGTERWIRVAGFDDAAGPFTLNAGLGGKVAGTVIDAVTEEPLFGIFAFLWNGEGFFVTSTSTDSEGRYALGNLAPGTYFVTTSNSFGYLDELYDDLPCPQGACDPTEGSPIQVEIEGSVSGIDFALDQGGMVTGEVLDAVSGMGALGVRVELWDDDGSFVDSAFTNANGGYVFEGLSTGTYFASTEDSAYADELYDDLPCPGGAPSGCDPTDGTPIEVVANSTTQDIDFVLDRLGTLTGTITETPTGDPVASARVEVWSDSGNLMGSDSTDASGNYAVGGLDTGTYLVVAEGRFANHTDELYDDLPCPGGPPSGCNLASGTPVDVMVNQTVLGIDFVLDRLGSISGTVTEDGSGDPIASLRVEIWNAQGSFVTSANTDSEGIYTAIRLQTGTYFVRTDSFRTYNDELYDDLPCENCNPTGGTPIEVELNATIVGIDFELVRKGSISGTVTDQETGDPISSVAVDIWNSAGSYVDSGFTDSSGAFTVDGLDAGTYFAATDLFSGNDYLDELFEELPCDRDGPGGCNPLNGTPIEVSDGAITSDIDFTLSLGGSISGTVTDAATGDPVTSGEVNIYDATGQFVDDDFLDGSGQYQVGGLQTGTYFARTRTSSFSGYQDELYDDLPCPDGMCNPTDGTPIDVVQGETSEGIDFELEREGTISGTVTSVVSGLPISGIQVEIYDQNGSFVDQDSTNSSGNYTVDSLPAGTYFARTDNLFDDYVDVLYDDLQCLPDCPPVITGTPIEVSLNNTTQGIDFALDRFGEISGIVTDASSGAPLSGVRIRVWSASGVLVQEGFSGSDGFYTVDELSAGTYFATTESTDYNDELFRDLPCIGGCDPTTGTPIAVSLNSTTRHIDFTLTRAGAIAGTVTQASNGQPISGMRVRIWDSGGSNILLVTTDSTGRYHAGGLEPGAYFATTDSFFDFLDELYDDLPCPNGACDPTSGTPIPVTVDTTTDGVDFALLRQGAISGFVVDAETGQPITNIRVEIWDEDSNFVRSDLTNGAGFYTVDDLNPGVYYATTDNFSDYLDELYDDLPCYRGAPSGCDPDKGTPILVEGDATTEGIDFGLILASTGISGVVTEGADGGPRANAIVDVWDVGGQHVTNVFSSASGAYYIELPPGVYYLSTDHGSPNFSEEVYDSILCPGAAFDGLCDPTGGTLVAVEDSDVVGVPGITSNIDFTLVSSVVFADGFESGDFSAWSMVVGGP